MEEIINIMKYRKNFNSSNTNPSNPHMRKKEQQQRAGQRSLWVYAAASCLLFSSGYLTGAQNRTIRGVTSQPHPTPPTHTPVLKPDKHEVGQGQIQLSHSSSMNRYPDEYGAARDYLRAHHSSSKASGYRLLSFGSATGEEAITLATMYYPDDDGNIGDKTVLFGVDLDQESIDKAKASWLATTTKNDGKIIPESKVTFFNGKDTSISEHGPYDAIFANSVLCFHGNRKATPTGILQKFTFEQFESSLEYLDGSLKVGGLLAIVNTNYHFSRSKVSKRYTPLETKCSNFVPKLDVESVTFEPNGNDFLADCVWVKNQQV
jgi:hypothetical protein